MGNILDRKPATESNGDVRRLIRPRHITNSFGNGTTRMDHVHVAKNRIKTTKYNMITFFPKNLYEQLHRVANLYFIFLVLLNFIPQINAFGKEISMLPVLFVLAVTAVKDAFEDYRRYKSDKQVNHLPCFIFNKLEQKYVPREWQDILVGDIVRLNCDEPVPADIVLLSSSDPLEVCYVDTASMDGESSLKQRQVVPVFTEASPLMQGGDADITLFDGAIECEKPNADILKFSGAVLTTKEERIPINSSHLLLRGCVIRNTLFVDGIVVYAGHETKTLLNSRGPRYKRSKVECQINRDVIWCIVVLMVMCVLCSIGAGVWLGLYPDTEQVPFIPYDNLQLHSPAYQGFLRFWTNVILFQVVVPVALYVTIELCKVGQVYFISRDVTMYHALSDSRAQCRALNITEDLGQVEYVFCDKTGTLTENQMVFNRCVIGGTQFVHRTQQDKANAELAFVEAEYDDEDVRPMEELPKDETEAPEDPDLRQAMCKMSSAGGADVPPQTRCVWDFFLLLALCNTVVVSPYSCYNGESASNEVSTTTGRLRAIFALRNRASRLHNWLTSNTRPWTLTDRQRLDSEESAGEEAEAAEVERQLKDKEAPERGRDGSGDGLALGEAGSLPCRVKYEAQSPDELVLVHLAAQYGCRLLRRTPREATLELPMESEVHVTVLHTLPFDPLRKRMSVITRDPGSGSVVLWCKGADSAVIPLLKGTAGEDDERKQVLQRSLSLLTEFANQGLRTLCMAKRVLGEDEYRTWLAGQREAEAAVENRDQRLQDSACRIEHSMELLGVTGVEDRLQEAVPETIAALQEAGMKIWIVSGDKQETTLSTAHSCRLLAPDEHIMTLNASDKETTAALIHDHTHALLLLREQHEDEHLSQLADLAVDRSYLQSFSDQPSDGDTAQQSGALIVDGPTLAFALETDLQLQFLRLAQACRSVLCCRTTPHQKAEVVKLVRDKAHKLTLAIGDGANDVSMLQIADVGVGVAGREGLQAAMASDFALARFAFLRRLLLVHGHWCYDRLVRMSMHMFFKNTVFVLLLMWFQFFNGFSGGSMIDDVNLILFMVVYTSLPPIVLGILDQDAPADLLYNNPSLYRRGLQSKGYTRRSYLFCLMDAIWQSLMQFFVPYFVYRDSTVGVWEFGVVCNAITVTSTLLHVCVETHHWTVVHGLGIFISFLGYVLVNLLISATCVTCRLPVSLYWIFQRALQSPTFWLTCLLATVVSMGPRFIIRALQGSLCPEPTTTACLLEKTRRKHVKAASKAPANQQPPEVTSQCIGAGRHSDAVNM